MKQRSTYLDEKVPKKTPLGLGIQIAMTYVCLMQKFTYVIEQ